MDCHKINILETKTCLVCGNNLVKNFFADLECKNLTNHIIIINGREYRHTLHNYHIIGKHNPTDFSKRIIEIRMLPYNSIWGATYVNNENYHMRYFNNNWQLYFDKSPIIIGDSNSTVPELIEVCQTMKLFS